MLQSNFIKVSAVFVVALGALTLMTTPSARAMSAEISSTDQTETTQTSKIGNLDGQSDSSKTNQMNNHTKTVTDSSKNETALSEPQDPIENNSKQVDTTPICVTAAANTAKWKVVNSNPQPVVITWTNLDTNVSGTYTAPNGESVLYTNYKDGLNNQTQFEYSNGVPKTSTNATNTECNPPAPTPPSPTCIDGTNAQNFDVVIKRNTLTNTSTATIITKGNALLCDDVTLYFSSYVMPDNYDGKSFEGNVTAYPQQKFDSDSVTLKKGTNGAHTFTVKLPDSCKNTQVDLYYAPEIDTVGANGHGTQNIKSDVYLSNGECQTPGGGSTNPGSPSNPSNPTTPNNPSNGTPGTGAIHAPTATDTPKKVGLPKTTTKLPTSLPETGGANNYGFVYALLFALLTYGAVYFALPRRAND